MAKKQSNTPEENGPLEEAVARLTEQVNELETKVNNFDPIAFAQEVQYEMSVWKQQVLDKLNSLEVQLLADRKKLGDLTDLIAKAEALLAKLEAIDFAALDPDKIKQLVLDALQTWREQVDKDVKKNTDRIEVLESKVSDLETAIKNLDPEAIKNAVLDALANWKTEIEKDHADCKKRITEAEKALDDFSKELEKINKELTEQGKSITTIHGEIKDLRDQIELILKEGIDPEKIKEEVERLIGTWKQSVEDRLALITRLQTDLANLTTKVNGLPDIPTVDEIKQAVLTALESWKTQLDKLVQDNSQLSQTNKTDIASLKTQLNDLTIKVNGLTGGGLDEQAVKVLITAELSLLQATFDQKITVLQTLLQNSINSLTTRVNAIEIQLGNLNWNGDINILVEQVLLALNTWQTQINQQITTLIANQTNIGVTINQLRIDLDALIIQFNNLAIPTPQEIDDQIQASLAPLLAQLASIQQILAGPLPDNWETQIQQMLDSLLQALQADILQLQQDKTTLQEALAALQTLVASLPTTVEVEALIQIQITAIKTEINLAIQQLEVKITDINVLIVSIQTTIQQIQINIQTNQVKIDALEVLILQVQTTVNNLPPIPTVDEIVNQVTIIINQWKTEIDIQITHLEECCEETAQGIKLARLCLTGWGIVGGLEIKSDDNCTVYLSKGMGITAQGELVKEYQNKVFTHYRVFDTAAADGWFKTFPAWELLEWESLGLPPDAPLPAGIHPLTPQTGVDLASPFIADKIVLLLPDGNQLFYLLIRRTDLIELLGKTALLKKLLGLHDDTDSLFSEDFSPADDEPTDCDLYKICNPDLFLPEIPLFRFGFRPPDECDPDELDDPNFPEICKLDDLYETWIPILEDAFNAVDNAMRLVTKQYLPLLFPQLDADFFTDRLDLLFEKWSAFKKHNANAPDYEDVKYYIQYFYDWARDLIAAYHELRSELQELMAFLCTQHPDLLSSHRPYLMLGPAMRPDQDGLAAPLRDEFKQPPIYNSNATRFETCRLYLRRYAELTEAFFLPGYIGDPQLPCWCHNHDEEWEPDFSRLRITPGKSYIYPLSLQSIPFYYPLVPAADSLQHYWNYRRTKTCTEDRHLSYHASDEPDSYSSLPEVIRPLYYSFDPYDFYRVEGHIGKWEIEMLENRPVGNPDPSIVKVPVIEALRFMIQRYNLDFDLMEIKIKCDGTDASKLSQVYNIQGQNIEATSFKASILGAEHLAGVPKGGTFIVITSEIEVEKGEFQQVAIADFSIPYRCCHTSSAIDDAAKKIEQINATLLVHDTAIKKVTTIDLPGQSQRITDVDDRISTLKTNTESITTTLSNKQASIETKLNGVSDTVDLIGPKVTTLDTQTKDLRLDVDNIKNIDLKNLQTADSANAQSLSDYRTNQLSVNMGQDNKINEHKGVIDNHTTQIGKLRIDVDSLLSGKKTISVDTAKKTTTPPKSAKKPAKPKK